MVRKLDVLQSGDSVIDAKPTDEKEEENNSQPTANNNIQPIVDERKCFRCGQRKILNNICQNCGERYDN
jgi:hypothetical protein